MIERDSFEWNESVWRGLKHLKCIECAYDCFDDKGGAKAEDKMLKHCRQKNHGRMVDGALSLQQFIEGELAQPNLVQGHRIAMAQLCWNTAQISAEAAEAMAKECMALELLGNHGSILSLDNGSLDDTYSRVVTTLESYPNVTSQIRKLDYNRGISHARNRLIDMATAQDAEYVLLVDGDIEIVPLSVYTMMRYLDAHRDVGCIGAYSCNYTTERDRATRRLTRIEENRVKSNIDVAWTQYGLFRMSMFDQGIRFDEDGPFGQPGWGFEDDDLCIQMLLKGWHNRYFGGMRYLHRNIRSSWVHIENQGFNVQDMFNKRKDFLVKKWSLKGYNYAKLGLIKAQTLPKAIV